MSSILGKRFVNEIWGDFLYSFRYRFQFGFLFVSLSNPCFLSDFIQNARNQLICMNERKYAINVFCCCCGSHPDVKMKCSPKFHGKKGCYGNWSHTHTRGLWVSAYFDHIITTLYVWSSFFFTGRIIAIINNIIIVYSNNR